MSSEKKDVALDHPRIWLQNAADAEAAGEERRWCQDKAWPSHEFDGEPTEYVRADIVDGLVAVLNCAREDILSLKNDRGCEFEGSDEDWVGEIDAVLSSYRKQGG